MQTLVQLRLELESVAQPITGHSQLIAIAAEEGLEVKTVKLPGKVGDRYDESFVLAQIENAQGYWIRHPHLLTDERIRNSVEARIRQGAIAFAELR